MQRALSIVVAGLLAGGTALAAAEPPDASSRVDLESGDRIVAAAWLDGEPMAQEVRFARRTAQGWSEPLTVSPRGPGSQVGLGAATLADGDVLLVWSAFDGQDTEVMWSRVDGDAASEPRRLDADNDVPDITPAVAAIPEGALATWSRYDGNDYRVWVARFDGTRWSTPRQVGPRGSVYPTFAADPVRTLLVFQQAVPASWWVMELDGDGKALRRARIESESDERPDVVEASSKGVVLEWTNDGVPVKSSRLDWVE